MADVEADDYKVRLDIFEGPLDLLLYLIKKDEVDIHSISIERITKQYLDYIDTFKMLNICLLYTSPSPRDGLLSRMPSSA